MKIVEATFLAKSGRTFGPFTINQLTQMQETGKIFQYTWIWSHSDKAWTPIDPPPANPTSKKSQTQYTRLKTASEVICYSQRTLLGGKFNAIDALGCELFSPLRSFTPAFPPKTSVTLNVIDGKKSTEFKGQVAEAKRTASGWCYRVFWAA